MIVLTIPYHSGDRDRASELCKLIGEIEPERRNDWVVRLVARFDCEHIDTLSMNAVGRRFDMSWTRTEPHAVGWPAGPNMMARQILHGVPRWLEDCGWSNATGIMFMEPDCVPLSRDWLTKLAAEWELARANGKRIMGSWRDSGVPMGHINGNCIITPESAMGLARHINQYFAWDCAISPYVRNHWHITGLIRNDFEGKNATEELLRTPETGDTAPVMVHGYKDRSAQVIARKWMKL